MDRTPVTSSNVASVGYYEDRSILEVEFHSGRVYQYLGVPAHHFLALTTGVRSVGGYLNAEIKPRYRCLRVR